MNRFFVTLGILAVVLLLLCVVVFWPDEPKSTDVTPGGSTTVVPSDGDAVYPITGTDTNEAVLPQGYTYTADKKNFNQILSVLPSTNFKPVLDGLYLDYYSVVPCQYQGADENVLRLVFDDSRSSRTTMSRYQSLVYTWEADMVHDLGDLVFPKILPSEREVVLKFSESDQEGFRRASLIAGGESRFIYYGYSDNVMYIGSTLECIEIVDDTIWGPGHEH